MLSPVQRLMLAFALTTFSAVSANAQNEPDHSALLNRMREGALTYTDRLQDFVCTQITTRSADKSGSGRHWKKVDVQEFELSYVDHKLHYKLLKVDGHTENVDARVKPGHGVSRGEFEGFRGIFSPKVNAEFTWDHDAMQDGKRLCVFRYDVSRANSLLRGGTNDNRQSLAHHGFVYADCATGALMRVQFESETGSLPVHGRQTAVGVQTDVRYRPTKIADREFLLPQSAETITRLGDNLTKSEIQFQNYRKFEVDSKVVLEPSE